MGQPRALIPYDKLRAGDIVFTSGRGLFSSIIRRMTGKGKKRNEVATHVGVIVDFHGQFLLAEMLNNGLQISSLEEYGTSRRAKLLSICRPAISREQQNTMMEEIALHRRKTIEYDWAGIIGFFTGSTGKEDRFYCSEYIVRLWKLCGYTAKLSTKQVSPQDIYESFQDGVAGTVLFRY